MSAANSIHVVGNLTAEPELRFTTSGRPVVNFRVAVNEVSVINGERRERTEYFSFVAWNSLAENISESLSKGMRVQVSGRLQIRKATVEGVDRFYTEIIADEVGLALRWQRVDREMVEKHNGKSPATVGGPDDELYGEDEPF